jgi:hypothetical protein
MIFKPKPTKEFKDRLVGPDDLFNHGDIVKYNGKVYVFNKNPKTYHCDDCAMFRLKRCFVGDGCLGGIFELVEKAETK